MFLAQRISHSTNESVVLYKVSSEHVDFKREVPYPWKDNLSHIPKILSLDRLLQVLQEWVT